MLSSANVPQARKPIPIAPVVELAARQACIYIEGTEEGRNVATPLVVCEMTPPVMKIISGQCGVNTSNLVSIPKYVGTDLIAVCAIPVTHGYRLMCLALHVVHKVLLGQSIWHKLRFRENSQGFLYAFKMPAQ